MGRKSFTSTEKYVKFISVPRKVNAFFIFTSSPCDASSHAYTLSSVHTSQSASGFKVSVSSNYIGRKY